jgi:hypothetical protein
LVNHGGESKFSPIHYLTNVIEEVIPAALFERAVDDFVDHVLKRLASRHLKKTELHELREILGTERANTKKARIRKLEALLGYDPDEAPQTDIKILAERSARVGASAVDEIAPIASPHRPRVRQVSEIFESLDRGAAEAIEFGAVPGATVMRARYDAMVAPEARPWWRGFFAAALARRDWALQDLPLSTPTLADRLGVRDDVLSRAPCIRGSTVGLGVRTKNDGFRAAFRTDLPKGRRFELARVIADHVFVNASEDWRPITPMRTARQQFQRAFAAEFLCPSVALKERFGERGPEAQSEIESVAEEFGVDTDVVFRQIENRRRIDEVYEQVTARYR